MKTANQFTLTEKYKSSFSIPKQLTERKQLMQKNNLEIAPTNLRKTIAREKKISLSIPSKFSKNQRDYH